MKNAISGTSVEIIDDLGEVVELITNTAENLGTQRDYDYHFSLDGSGKVRASQKDIIYANGGRESLSFRLGGTHDFGKAILLENVLERLVSAGAVKLTKNGWGINTSEFPGNYRRRLVKEMSVDMLGLNLKGNFEENIRIPGRSSTIIGDGYRIHVTERFPQIASAFDVKQIFSFSREGDSSMDVVNGRTMMTHEYSFPDMNFKEFIELANLAYSVMPYVRELQRLERRNSKQGEVGCDIEFVNRGLLDSAEKGKPHLIEGQVVKGSLLYEVLNDDGFLHSMKLVAKQYRTLLKQNEHEFRVVVGGVREAERHGDYINPMVSYLPKKRG